MAAPASALTWNCETFDQNQNANAIRWGTLYNFRFDSDRPSESTAKQLRFFKTGSPVTVDVVAPFMSDATPTATPTDSDCNGNGKSDTYRYSHGHNFSHAHADSYRHADCHRAAHSNSAVQPVAKSSSHTCTSPLGLHPACVRVKLIRGKPSPLNTLLPAR